MQDTVRDKILFITGAASGIGLEIARAFAQQGAKVVISDLNLEAAQNQAALLAQQGYQALGMGCNVTVEEELREAMEQTKKHYGAWIS